MFRIGTYFATALVVAGALACASAQSLAQDQAQAKPSRLKMTREHLHELRLKWSANHARYVACRKEVKAKGLIGDDRWFFMEDCMGKT
jgi:hypothetical protein